MDIGEEESGGSFLRGSQGGGPSGNAGGSLMDISMGVCVCVFVVCPFSSSSIYIVCCACLIISIIVLVFLIIVKLTLATPPSIVDYFFFIYYS